MEIQAYNTFFIPLLLLQYKIFMNNYKVCIKISNVPSSTRFIKIEIKFSYITVVQKVGVVGTRYVYLVIISKA